MKLYHITIDRGEEDFFIIANSYYEAIGLLIKSDNGFDDSDIDRFSLWGETEVKIGAILS